MAMAAGWFCFPAELRRRWRAWLALALIVGAFAGVVEAAAAGARRTDAAYPALLAWSDAPDVMLFSFPGESGTFGRFSARAAASLPQAERSAILISYDVASPAVAEIMAPETNAVLSRFWHRRILSVAAGPGEAAPRARPAEILRSDSRVCCPRQAACWPEAWGCAYYHRRPAWLPTGGERPIV
jgi:hypothetical protein